MPELDNNVVDSRAKADPFEGFDLLRIRVTGTCMSPFILPNDIIVVKRADCEDLRIGTIAVYKSDSDLVVAHRFYGCVRKQGNKVLKVKGDLSTGTFEYVKPEQMLGRVVATQRGNRIIAVEAWYWCLLGIICARIHPIPWLLLPPRDLPRKLAMRILLLLQCSRLYRRLAWHLVGKRVRFRVAASEDLRELSMNDGSKKDETLEGRNVQLTEETDMIGREPRAFVALLGKKIVGRVCVTQVPKQLDLKSYWAINLVWVHGRYRGAGVGRGLLIMAASTLHEEGVHHVCGLVLQVNKQMLALGRHVDAVRPLRSELVHGAKSPIVANDHTFLARSIVEGLQALKRQGILERYRGAGCCDRLLDEL